MRHNQVHPAQYQQPQGQYPPGQYQQPQNQYQQPPNQYQQPPDQYQQPPGQYQQPPGQYQQPQGQYQQPQGQYQQPQGQYQQPQGQYQQPQGQYQQPQGQYQDGKKPPMGEFPVEGRAPDANLQSVPPPPNYEQATAAPTDTADSFRLAEPITEAEARQCLVEYADSRCCWGKGAAESLTFSNVTSANAVHYVLETFLETRGTCWVQEPFAGMEQQGAQAGNPPPPWAIQLPQPASFAENKIEVEVPNTSTVRTCNTCMGSTRVQCHKCNGMGRTHCSFCNGSGRSHRAGGNGWEQCFHCNGSGWKVCYKCHGVGMVRCHVCEGAGRVRHFMKMIVEYKTRMKDFVLERSPLPDELVRSAKGQTLFEDTQPMLHPIHSFPEPEINRQSAALIQEAKSLTRSGRILAQRHVIRSVPVHQCDCRWKDKSLQFFVYGNEKQVHAANYPQTCCWGCQLL